MHDNVSLGLGCLAGNGNVCYNWQLGQAHDIIVSFYSVVEELEYEND